MHQLPPALAPLGAFKQFVPYRLVANARRPGKTDKIPLGSTTDPATWMTFTEAAAAGADGVGFVFADTGLWFLDIDNCLIDGQWSPLAQQLLGVFAGCAVEVSQSGKGLHIIGAGALPLHGCRNDTYGLELYHTGRFVALTGAQASGDVLFKPEPRLLEWLVASYFPPHAASERGDGDLSDAPVPEWRGPADDEVLIRRMLGSVSAGAAFGSKASFADLWDGDAGTLAKFYPSSTDDFGRSEADAALAQHLAFWTGKHGERIERLMRMSGLARQKWDDREGYYLPRTISNACARQVDVYQERAVEVVHAAPEVRGEPGTIKPVEGETFVNAEAQLSFFAGCTYVVSAHRVLTADGSMLKPEQFRAKFGGYSFPMDKLNERVSRNAWEAFTESQIFRAPKADATMFRPDLPPGYILNEGGYSRVNSYVPVRVARMQGDASPFLRHLATLLPNENDQRILLSYLAACVQHPGRKFRWAPLIQGVPGNGKTLFTMCLIQAIGERYCHIPSTESISEKFNAWLFDKLLIGVEDVYTAEFKGDLIEVLKPMITGEFLSKRAMQTDQVMQNSVANFIFNSNHKNGLRKDRNDRRIAPFFCAQQSEGHLQRDGLTEDYFVSLYGWLNNGGYAIVAEFLHTFDIPDEYNPATLCQRAPRTTSTDAAIEESLGGIEQEIMEAIHREQHGFRGGFISAQALGTLLDKLQASRRITHNKRQELLEPLGFIPHPALPDGRTLRFTTLDGARVRLFVSKTSEYLKLTDPEEVTTAYEKYNSPIDK